MSGRLRVPVSDLSSRARTVDEQLHALSRVERRRCLLALFETPADDGGLRVDTAWGERARGTDTELVLSAVHLPVLSDAGLIEWDQTAGVVRRGPRFERVEPLLAVLAGDGPP